MYNNARVPKSVHDAAPDDRHLNGRKQMEGERFRLQPDIPVEWRAEVEGIDVGSRAIPDLPSKTAHPQLSLSAILADDQGVRKVPISHDRNEILLNSVASLEKEIAECRRTLEHAESKRREIASNAELIHGECDSQISAEQRLNVFVKSIDSVLHYFEDLERIGVDFMSPMFTVLSPDFAANLSKIEKGIQFFEMNSNYRDAKLYLLKYESLQTKAAEIVKHHVSNTFESILQRLNLSSRDTDPNFESNMYTKFKSVAKTTRGLFQLSEKTPVFTDILGLYTSTRMSLLKPLISPPINDLSEIRQRASLVLRIVRAEYDLAREFFDFNGHPMYLKCFSEMVSDIGQLFYDSCCALIVKSSDRKQLCEVCIVLKGDVLQDEIGRIPVAAEKLRSQFMRLLSTAQERLLFRVEVCTKQLSSDSSVTMDTISRLYYALPSESFGEIACNLLIACLDSLKTASRKYPPFECDVFLLSHYLVLREGMKNLNGRIVGTQQVVDFEPVTDFLTRLLRFDSSIYQLGGERGFVKSLAGLSRVVSSTIDGRKQLESATSLCFQSVASYATQILTQPLLNLKARQGKEKSQILAAVEGVEVNINEHFKPDIGDIVQKHISDRGQLSAILDVLHGHLISVVTDCVKSFGEIDQETQVAIEKLKTKIGVLKF